MKRFLGFILFLRSKHIKHMRVLIKAEDKAEALKVLKESAKELSDNFIVKVYASQSKRASHKLKG